MLIVYIYTSAFTVLGSAKQGIKFVSKGDSVFLPCIINASNNIYPQPVHIEWWKESISCDLFECGGVR